MSEDKIKVGFCWVCKKNIYVSDKEMYAVPVKIDGKFSHNMFYHIKCYEKKKD